MDNLWMTKEEMEKELDLSFDLLREDGIIRTRIAQDWLAMYSKIIRMQKKIDIAEKALRETSYWSQESQDQYEKHGAGISLWRGCVATSNIALQKMEQI